jgi:DNA (cytosine-5)-methyltransferase 1
MTEETTADGTLVRSATDPSARNGERLIVRQPELLLWNELVIDNFAGFGGASDGIERALGRPADIAINHDPQAIAAHKANHPLTDHYVEDVRQVDPRKACGDKPVGLVWLSPDCTHFSRAKGAVPVQKHIRGLAWVAVRWARSVKPRVIMVENVPEFQTWGPLMRDPRGGVDEDGRPNMVPNPKRAGSTFNKWVRQLESLGYEVEWRMLEACDYGAPTIRKRLFVVARCDGKPIEWPEITHGHVGNPHRTAAEIIEWDVPAPSIFDPERRPLAENTQRRIADGVQRYVIDSAQPFIVRHGHVHADGRNLTFRGQSLDKPLGTVCGTNDKHLVVPWLRKAGTDDSPAPLVASFILQQNGTPGKKGYMVGHEMTRPLGTVTGQNQKGLVTAFLVRFNGKPSAKKRTSEPIDKPLGTVTGRDRFALATVTIEGESYEIVDIGMRMLTPRELCRAQGFEDDYEIDDIVAPLMKRKRGKGGKRELVRCKKTGAVREGPLSKTAKIRMVGNSVSPNVAEALVAANIPRHELVA